MYEKHNVLHGEIDMLSMNNYPYRSATQAPQFHDAHFNSQIY